MAAIKSVKLLVFSDLHLTGEGHSYLSRKRVDNITNFISGALSPRKDNPKQGKYKSAAETLHRLDSLLSRHFDHLDHVLLAGDIIDSGLSKELTGLEKLLSRYSPEKFSFIPGNHDILPFSELIKTVAPGISAINNHLFKTQDSGARFRSGKILFNRNIIPGFNITGIDTNRKNNLHFRGILDPPLLSDIRGIINDPQLFDSVKILLMHHNPALENRFHYDYLPGRDEFLKILSEHAALTGRTDVVVMYGHSHSMSIVNDLVKNTCFICVPMFAMKSQKDHLLIDISPDGTVTDITVD